MLQSIIFFFKLLNYLDFKQSISIYNIFKEICLIMVYQPIFFVFIILICNICIFTNIYFKQHDVNFFPDCQDYLIRLLNESKFNKEKDHILLPPLQKSKDIKIEKAKKKQIKIFGKKFKKITGYSHRKSKKTEDQNFQKKIPKIK